MPKAEFEFGKTMIFVKKLTCVPCLIVLHFTTLDPSLKDVRNGRAGASLII